MRKWEMSITLLILSSAHRAANPDAHPIRDDVRKQMPSLQDIEKKHGPTKVHLQVYDGAPNPS